MDEVIEAHVRRLPPLDERWEPREYDRLDLASALLQGGVAGVATHPLDNVRGNIMLLIEGDPDKQFGLSGVPGGFDLDAILSMVERGSGTAIDHDARFGPVDIRPEPILEVCDAFGDRLVTACGRGETVILATGHPTGLALFYHRIDRWLTDHGATVLTPAHGMRWRDPLPHHDWIIDHWGGVGMLTDGHEPRHTHRPDAMQRMLVEATPDLVLADHGFAGAAIEAGVETLNIADVNDPALLVAQALGRTTHVLVMDDHVDPAAYWPCFQAIAARGVGS
jgi:hypothetical protein